MVDIEALEARDSELRQEAYAIEAEQAAAFEQYVAPIRERKRENKRERGKLRRRINLVNKLGEMSDDERADALEFLAEAVDNG
jgi:hypothetical protein